LSEIGKAVGIESEEEVRKVVLDMVSFALPHLPASVHSLTNFVFPADRMLRNHSPNFCFGYRDVLGPPFSIAIYKSRCRPGTARKRGTSIAAKEIRNGDGQEQGIFGQGAFLSVNHLWLPLLLPLADYLHAAQAVRSKEESAWGSSMDEELMFAADRAGMGMGGGFAEDTMFS
jgi:hypothetical protein